MAATATPAAGAGSCEPEPVFYTLATWRVARFECSAGHTLAGLHVLFRPWVEPALLRDMSEALQKLVGNRIARPFHLGMTSAGGYLGPPNIETEKLARVAGFLATSDVERARSIPADVADLLPDSFKLVPGTKYEVHLVHNPSREYAEGLLARLERGEPIGTAHVLVPEDDGLVKIAEPAGPPPPTGLDPYAAMFLQPGAALYGGWCLYRDMPTASCQSVQAQVRKLNAHLGALRYPIGNGHWPYLPDLRDTDDKSGESNDGRIDVRVWNAIVAFQTHAGNGSTEQPVRVEGASPHAAFVGPAPGYEPAISRAALEGDAHDRLPAKSLANAWAYARGSKAPLPAARAERADGVVEATTAAAIQAWLDQGLRKPGAILVRIVDPRSWGSWIRLEAAHAWYAWDQLVRALGFPEGICANHCYRSALVDVTSAGYGRAVRSIHKSGLAVDVGMTGFAYADEPWPVSYEQQLVNGAVRWRVYGLSDLPVPTATEPSMWDQQAATCEKTIQRKLDALESTPAPNGEDAALARCSSALRAEMRDRPAFFARYFKPTLTPWHYDPFSATGGNPAPAVTAQARLAEHRSEHVARHRVRVKSLESEVKDLQAALDAGPKNRVAALRYQLGQKTAALSRARAVLAAAEARLAQAQADTGTAADPSRASFLDLTAVAALVGFSPIGAFAKGWQVKGAERSARNLVRIADQVQEALAGNASEKVVARRARRSLEWDLDELDVDLMREWNKALGDAAAAAKGSVDVSAAPLLLAKLSLAKGREQHAEEIAKILERFPDRYFLAPLRDPGTPAIRTGETWAAQVRSMGEALARAREERTRLAEEAAAAAAARRAKARAKPEERAATNAAAPAAPPPAGSQPPTATVPAGAESAPKPKLPSVEKWSGSFLPVFLHGAEADLEEDRVPLFPGDTVIVPAPGEPIGMEWWHFQRSDLFAARTWGDLLVDIGWVRDCLLGGALPRFHLRAGVGYSAETLGTPAR